jgi:lipopolysaccharide transport system permease protein
METKKKQQLVIQPGSSLSFLDWKELWDYRELFYFLAWRDVNVRYKQTVLGIGWAILQPLFSMLIFTLFFGKLASIPSNGIPYPLFSLSALVPWLFFSNGISNSANSIVQEANLVKKVYFPRMIIPFASVSAGLVDFCFAFLMLLCFMPFYDFYPTTNLVYLPLGLLFLYVATIGVGLWLSAWNVLFRDVRYVLPFFIQLLLFITPVVYPLELVPQQWQPLFAANPMVGVIELFRFMTLGTPINLFATLSSLAVALTLFVTGALYFKKIQTSFADVV